ncbi:EipB family protein [Acidiphilium sp.]|uniref:EipB family protein n=1 Tax=Acidiphilium sp. TaxID=527 RepID=UPI003D02602E
MRTILLAGCACFMASAALAAAPIRLTGQAATYTLALSKVRGHAVTGATGRLQFDVLDTCKAYTVSQRMTLLIRNQDGSLSRTVSNYDTWESKDGHRLSFVLRQTEDGKTTIEDQGTATTGPQGGEVTYIVPKGKIVKLPPGTLFPMAHTKMILQAAAAGKPYIDPPLFDGTSSHGAEHTFVAILGHRGPRHSKFAPLTVLPSTLVDIGFFRRSAHDTQPDFRTQMRYYTDGVSRDVRLDFGNFVLHGDLTALSVPPSACPSGQRVSSDAAPRDPNP